MSLFEAIVLGIVQGFTEFLPISSTAHLTLVPWLFGWTDPGLTFDIALHVGTLVAVLAYFFRDWVQVISQGFGLSIGNDPVLKQNRMLLWLLVLATIPAGVFGMVFKEQAETTWRSPYVIATSMIVFGIILWWAERHGRRIRDIGKVGFLDALFIGCAQAFAVIPGVSRSGSTISAGLIRNLDRTAAARFSFLLSTPVIGGAAAKDMYDLFKHEGGLQPDMRMPFIVGIVVSGIVGALVIGVFMRSLRRFSLNFFVAYRIIFGIIIIALAQFFRL
jgi:undecaprenyl-diphosphatase